MPRRSRRADKRVHSRYLFEVLLGLTSSDSWREPLIALEPPDTLTIDTRALSGCADAFPRIVRRYDLSYGLSVVLDNEIGDPYPVEGAKVFKLSAVHHPNVYGYAEEFPEALGKSRGAA